MICEICHKNEKEFRCCFCNKKLCKHCIADFKTIEVLQDIDPFMSSVFCDDCARARYDHTTMLKNIENELNDIIISEKSDKQKAHAIKNLLTQYGFKKDIIQQAMQQFTDNENEGEEWKNK